MPEQDSLATHLRCTYRSRWKPASYRSNSHRHPIWLNRAKWLAGVNSNYRIFSIFDLCKKLIPSSRWKGKLRNENFLFGSHSKVSFRRSEVSGGKPTSRVIKKWVRKCKLGPADRHQANTNRDQSRGETEPEPQTHNTILKRVESRCYSFACRLEKDLQRNGWPIADLCLFDCGLVVNSVPTRQPGFIGLTRSPCHLRGKTNSSRKP
jgi:hypothetical protein